MGHCLFEPPLDFGEHFGDKNPPPAHFIECVKGLCPKGYTAEEVYKKIKALEKQLVSDFKKDKYSLDNFEKDAKIRIEIEITKQDWYTLDLNSDTQILLSGEMDIDMSAEVVAKLLIKKYPVVQTGTYEFKTEDENGYFYGYGYVPFFKDNSVEKFIFRTKSPVVYHEIMLYSN